VCDALNQGSLTRYVKDTEATSFEAVSLLLAMSMQAVVWALVVQSSMDAMDMLTRTT